MQDTVSQRETEKPSVVSAGKTARDSTVQSITRALRILEALGKQQAISLTDLSKSVNLHKSTTYRLLGTMEREGYVRQDHNTERFSLGLKILGLAEGLLANMDVREHALEGMQELMAETQETVHLGVLLGLDVMCIESVVSDRRNAIGSMAGKRTQVHVSSMGKVILAFSPETTVSEALQVRGLPRLTPSTITEEDEFLQALAAIRETGYAVSDEEEEVGIRCVAAPIWDHRHHPIAALSVAAPAARLEGKTLAEIAELLVRHSNRITVSLGG